MANVPRHPRLRRVWREPLTLFLLAAVPLWLLLALLGIQTFSFRDDLWQTLVNEPGWAWRLAVFMVPGAFAAFLLWLGWVVGRKW